MTPYHRTPPHRFLDVDGHRIASWTVGRGPDVLFVHGWPLHAATFRDVVGELSDSFTCHLIDLPGAGRTESPPDARISFRGHADILFGTASALGLDRYAIVAHDSGGFAARHCAARDPRVAAMVLGDTEIPGWYAWQLHVYLATMRLPFGGAMLAGLMSSRTIRRSSLAFGTCFSDLGLLDGEFHQLFVEPLLRSRAAANGQTRAFRTLSLRDLDDLSEVHRSIEAPVRLVWGADDTFFPLAGAKKMLSEFKGGADLKVIDDARLFAHEERPREFAAHARNFLERHLGPEIRPKDSVEIDAQRRA